MNVWDKYKVNELPEEHRAEIIKTIVKEEEESRRALAREREESNRTRITDDEYNVTRRLWIFPLLVFLITSGIVIYNVAELWRDVQIKSLSR